MKNKTERKKGEKSKTKTYDYTYILTRISISRTYLINHNILEYNLVDSLWYLEYHVMYTLTKLL
jgi:hypothetical protein